MNADQQLLPDQPQLPPAMEDMPEDEMLLDEETQALGKFDALSPDDAADAGGRRPGDWPRRWRFGSREHLLPLRVRMSLLNFL